MLNHRTVLQLLRQVNLLPSLQSLLQQGTRMGQHALTAYQHPTPVGRVYHETHVSGQAQVLQGDQHNHYHYSCPPISHSHGNAPCEAHSSETRSLLALDSDSQSPFIWSSKASQRQFSQCTTQEAHASSTSFDHNLCAESRHSDRQQARRFATSAIDPKRKWKLRYRSYWLRKAWDFETLRALGSWTFCFRTCNILNFWDPIWNIIQENNVVKFRQLITSGQYTINDQDQRGGSLLKVSCLL